MMWTSRVRVTSRGLWTGCGKSTFHTAVSPQRLKPSRKQASCHSNESLHRPKSSATLTFSAACQGLTEWYLVRRCIVTRFRADVKRGQSLQRRQLHLDLVPLSIFRRVIGAVANHILIAQLYPDGPGYGRKDVGIVDGKS